MKTVVAAILILVGLFIALVIAVESCSGGGASDETSPPNYPANPGEVSPEASPQEPTTSIEYGLPDTGGVRL